MQHFDSDFSFDMDDSFNLCSQSMSCPSATTSFSSTTSMYDPFTPSTRRTKPSHLKLEFNGYQGPHGFDMTPPPTGKGNFIFGPMIKSEHDHMSFVESLPTTPMKKMDTFADDYSNMFDMQMASHMSMGSLTPSNSFGMNTISPEAAMGPFMMTPTRSLSGSDSGLTEGSSTWSLPTTESPISFFNIPDVSMIEMERHTQSPMGRFPLQHPGMDSPNQLRNQRKMMLHETQRRTSELQRAQIRAQRKRSCKPESTPVDVVRRAMCKCDYPGCNKAFRRNEHLKRHKQTYHGEGPNRFRCEFCGKDQFNRQDNLNNHRKLHARPNSRNRGVEYKPEAVPVIELEERSRKKRAPPKSKTADKDDEDDYDF